MIVYAFFIILAEYFIDSENFFTNIFQLNHRDFFGTFHQEFFSWDENLNPMSLNDNEGFLISVWQGFNRSFYGIGKYSDLSPINTENMGLFINSIILILLILYGTLILIKKFKYFKLIILLNFIWIILFESYEPERWTWMIIFIIMGLSLAIQDIINRVINLIRNIKDELKNKEIKKNKKNISKNEKDPSVLILLANNPKIIYCWVIFLLLVPTLFIPIIKQNEYYLEDSPEIYASKEMEVAAKAFNNNTNCLVTVHRRFMGSYTFGLVFAEFTYFYVYRLNFDNPNFGGLRFDDINDIDDTGFIIFENYIDYFNFTRLYSEEMQIFNITSDDFVYENDLGVLFYYRLV